MRNPDKPSDRPTVPDVLPFIASIYARHCAGCCLHVMVDDYNVEQDVADYCLYRALEQGHGDCIAAATMMAQMTTTQRRKASKIADKRGLVPA